MPEFKGFDDWVEIFNGGKQQDSTGREHDGDTLIQKAVNTFNTAKHEPPLVVGHPKDNAPAFGWVEGLKTVARDGQNILMGKFKQVVPEFAALAEKGLYKKRSASFYPDGRLRHVGFLGAAPPAVKGLADLKFEDSEETIFNFEVPTGPKEGKMKFKDFMEAFKFWKQVEADPDLDLPPITRANETPAGFTEADMESARAEAAEEAAQAEREKVEAEFAEKARKKAQDARQGEIKAWYDENLAAGKVIPAWDKLGLREFMQRLDADEEISFSEGEGKVSRLDWFTSFMESLPNVVNFKEVAARDKDVTGNAAAKLTAIINKKMSDKEITYGAAFSEAQRENPDLAREYAQELSQPAK